MHNFFFLLFSSLFVINMVEILMMSAELATVGLLKIQVFRKKSYDVIISVHDITSKVLSHDSNYTVDVVM